MGSSYIALLAALLVLPVVAVARAADTLPTPFTADQIRIEFSEGLEIVSRTWTPEGESFSRLIVERSTEESMTFVDRPEDADGAPRGDATRGTASWEALRDHAAFPAERAERRRQVVETPLGSLEGWLYSVRSTEGPRSSFFFADRYPGPPVVYESHDGGELVLRVEMLERRRP